MRPGWSENKARSLQQTNEGTDVIFPRAEEERVLLPSPSWLGLHESLERKFKWTKHVRYKIFHMECYALILPATFSNFTPGTISWGDKNIMLRRHLHPQVDSSIIYNSHNMETTKVSPDRWMNNENVDDIQTSVIQS